MPLPVTYDLQGRKRTSALSHSAVGSRQARLHSAFTSVAESRKNSYQLISPWDLEFQRHLVEGNRLRSNRYYRRSRSVQSSNKEVLLNLVIQSLASVSPELEESSSLDAETPEWNRSHRYSDVADIEFGNTTDGAPSHQNCSTEPGTMSGSRRQSFVNSQAAGEQVLQYNFPDVEKKVLDNEGMGINTFSYLQEQPASPNEESDNESSGAVSSEDESPVREWADSTWNLQQETAGCSDDESLEIKAKIHVSFRLILM
ncbi:hypothetical protein D915_005001 [Fasciola hepatica]|uniref:Uncharacterized protein n=1 Tax=Fasciola hepatica TaxID=6192 RepID=A0A4E0R341_FASHE|nr:hypothetical protein D915_005001 [Fasciola hepatica]